MSVLSDRWIKKMAIEKEMISPFVEKQNGPKRFEHRPTILRKCPQPPPKICPPTNELFQS